ncbi:MAG: AAA family ATPase [Candidatus Thorarchaeota archaeon]
MEDSTISQMITIVAPEDIGSEGIQQYSVKQKAIIFHQEIREFNDARKTLTELGLVFGGRVLLAGPVGTDFVAFADTLSKEIPLKKIHFRVSETISRDRLLVAVRTLFELARRESPALVFIEKIDTLFTASTEVGMLVADLLREISWDEDELIVIASTARPEELEAASVVDFDRTFVFSNPTNEDRTKVISEVLAGAEGIDIPTIIEMTEGWGFSDLRHLATALAIKREHGTITLKDVIDLLQDNGIVPVGGIGGTAEIVRKISGAKMITEQMDAIYPSDFLDQLYLMMVSEDYSQSQHVIEILNAGLPLSTNDTRFLARFPFVLAGSPDDRLTRLISAKKNHDRLMRVMGRGG